MTNQTDRTSEDFVIVQATDLLPDGDTTLEHSLALTRLSGGRLITLHVAAETTKGPLPDPEKLLKNWSKEQLGSERHSVVCRTGEKPKKGLLNSLDKIDADLLVVGTRQQKENIETKTFRNSVSEIAALDADIATLVVHIGQPGMLDTNHELNLRRILLPVGDGVEARDAIRGLTDVLHRLKIDDVDIFLLRVGDDEILEYLTLPEHDGWRWHRENRQGYVSQVIAEVCAEKDIDLITMSTRGQDGVIDVFSGTHTQKVIRRVPCPVLSIPVQSED